MKKLIMLCAALVLTACASVSQTDLINLTPSSTLSSSKVADGLAFTLTSQDIRSAQFIAVIKHDGEEQAQPMHAKQNVRKAYEAAVYQQFFSQGFTMTKNSNNIVNVQVVDALATVNQSPMKYDIEGKVTLKITAETPNGKFVRTYTGSGTKSGSFTADKTDVEEVINRVSSRVLTTIAKDSELTKYMKGNF
ncbi:YajG family lipoprotein [Vibrio sp. CK2-1]|uniref:YajG family lipoprotein n=1 Tax=Vibrio sp. CK2-1 TaxID=2912249 RepID=UPI001F3CF930|nr:YajG family lipoprotein [Vibrio sp. CK2-1]MCF7354056.1 YajG family lipoprotein [Vibrio sp. CK2-1]